MSHGLAAGANRKKGRVRIFLKSLFMQLQRFISSFSFSILYTLSNTPSKG